MQFKCKSCGYKFDAQEGEYVICPHCKSDNVGPFKPSPLKVVLPFLGVLVIAIGTFFVIQYVKKNKDEAPAKEEVVQQNVAGEVTEKKVETPAAVEAEPAKVEPVTLDVTNPGAPRGGKYSIIATANNIPSGVKVKYLLKDSHGSTVFQESEDGKFKSVPASKEKDGMYQIAVVDAATGNDLCSRVIYGYIVEVVTVKKMTKDELEVMVNGRSNDLLASHPQISKKVVLAFDNLKEDEKKPASFDAIFEKLIMGDWESVQITAVSYEKSGRINKVSMHIKHLEF